MVLFKLVFHSNSTEVERNLGVIRGLSGVVGLGETGMDD